MKENELLKAQINKYEKLQAHHIEQIKTLQQTVKNLKAKPLFINQEI